MQGVLRDSGLRVSTERIGKSLKRVRAVPQERQRQNTIDEVPQERQRQNTIDEVNPTLYDDQYFGKILHLDQNEELGVFGVTYVNALDDYSGKIVAGVTMPRKNNLVIYDRIYRYSTNAFFK